MVCSKPQYLFKKQRFGRASLPETFTAFAIDVCAYSILSNQYYDDRPDKLIS